MEKQNTIKIGDKVMWRGCFGRDDPELVEVVGLEVTEKPGGKYGKPVKEVSWDQVKSQHVMFVLENEKWAYSDQISPA